MFIQILTKHYQGLRFYEATFELYQSKDSNEIITEDNMIHMSAEEKQVCSLN